MGEQFPLHVTSTGKLFLAQLSHAERKQYFARPLAKIASGTLDDPAILTSEISDLLVTGVAWTVDELEDGLTSIAAPIYQQEQFAAGLWVSVPNYRLTDKELLANQVCDTAAAITQLLGE